MADGFEPAVVGPKIVGERLLEQVQNGPNLFDVLAGLVHRLRPAVIPPADFLAGFLELFRHDACELARQRSFSSQTVGHVAWQTELLADDVLGVIIVPLGIVGWLVGFQVVCCLWIVVGFHLVSDIYRGRDIVVVFVVHEQASLQTACVYR